MKTRKINTVLALLYISVFVVLAILQGCTTAAPDTKPIRTFVVITSFNVDTIKATSYTLGNFTGIGRAVLFKTNGVLTGTLKIPVDGNFIIKSID